MDDLTTDRVRRAALALHLANLFLERTQEYLDGAEADERACMDQHGLFDRVRDAQCSIELLLVALPLNRGDLPDSPDAIGGFEIERRYPLAEFDQQEDRFVRGKFCNPPGVQVAGQLVTWALDLLMQEFDASEYCGTPLEGAVVVVGFIRDALEGDGFPAPQVLRDRVLQVCGADLVAATNETKILSA